MYINFYFSNAASWESIFSKSSDSISETELNCCRRIVQLCRDCLLIVYQFAAEAKAGSQSPSNNPSYDKENMTNTTG